MNSAKGSPGILNDVNDLNQLKIRRKIRHSALPSAWPRRCLGPWSTACSGPPHPNTVPWRGF